ncbi:MAG: hypothetical protein ACTHL8_24350 [Burkholderiaceae bacterium]
MTAITPTRSSIAGWYVASAAALYACIVSAASLQIAIGQIYRGALQHTFAGLAQLARLVPGVDAWPRVFAPLDEQGQFHFVALAVPVGMLLLAAGLLAQARKLRALRAGDLAAERDEQVRERARQRLRR